MLEGLRGELMRLSIRPGRMNTEMATGRPSKVDVITEPDRVAKLKMIAAAYNACKITAEQASDLVSKV